MLAGLGRGEVEANPVAAALRDAMVRFRLPSQPLVDLIEARAFDLYDEPMGGLSDLERYAMWTSSTLIELAARILNDGSDPKIGDFARHAGIAYGIAGLLRVFARHASRGQLYLPTEVMQRHGAQAVDVFSGTATTELRAGLAELRLRARQHLAAARDLLATVPPAVAPALLPIALVRPVLDRMERRGYQPFSPVDAPQWHRQWVLWRAARFGLRQAF